MKIVLFTTLFLIANVAIGECSLTIFSVKKGGSVPLPFSGSKDIKRSVPAGIQIFHLEGDQKGKLTDEKGNELDSWNLEISNGTMIIKNVSEADEGSYQECSSVGSAEKIQKTIREQLKSLSGRMIIIELKKED